jgi:hypothetical protein
VSIAASILYLPMVMGMLICQVVNQTNTDMCRIFMHRITHVPECA